jgi:TRAP-type C4-dicarboxylate transport system permease small subunit
MKKIISAFTKIASVLSKVAGIILLLVALLVILHICMRLFFNSGLHGVYEMVQYGVLMVVALTLAENELSGGNVIVTVLLDRMRPRVANIIEIIMYLLTTGGIIYVLINQIGMTGQKYQTGAVTGVLLIPHWIILIVICVGLFFFVCGFIVRVFNMIDNHKALSNSRRSSDEIAAEMNVNQEF